MVEITLKVSQCCDSDAGTITLRRVDGPEPRDMGMVVFDGPSEKNWLLMVLMEFHPYVTLLDPDVNDPKIYTSSLPCCSH